MLLKHPDGMDVREKILAQTTKLIAERGFEATSLQAVANAVGVRKPSILHHFSSKEELRRAVLEQLLSRWNDILPKLLLASTRTGLAKFDAVMEEVVGFFASDPDRARLIIRELLDRPKTINHSDDVRRWMGVIAEYIHRGQEAGQVQAGVDPQAYVLHIANMVLAVVASTQTFAALLPNAATPPRARAIAELIRIARSGLFTESYLKHQESKQDG